MVFISSHFSAWGHFISLHEVYFKGLTASELLRCTRVTSLSQVEFIYLVLGSTKLTTELGFLCHATLVGLQPRRICYLCLLSSCMLGCCAFGLSACWNFFFFFPVGITMCEILFLGLIDEWMRARLDSGDLLHLPDGYLSMGLDPIKQLLTSSQVIT